MYCLKCGQKLPDNAVFCDVCGAETRNAQSSTPMAPPAAVTARPRPRMEVKTNVEIPSRRSDRGFLVWLLAAIALLLVVTTIVLIIFLGKDNPSVEGQNTTPGVQNTTQGTQSSTPGVQNTTQGTQSTTQRQPQIIGKATLSECLLYDDWTYCSISQQEAGEETHYMHTFDTAIVTQLLEKISSLEVTEVEWEPWLRANEAEKNLYLYVSNDYAPVSIEVFESGLILVKADQERWAFLDGEAVYASLYSWVPAESVVSLQDIWPEDYDISYIIFVNKNGSSYESINDFSVEDKAEIADRLCQEEVTYGPFSAGGFQGYMSVLLYLMPPEDSLKSVTFCIYSDGTGNVDVGGWSYDVTNAQSLYNAFLTILQDYGDQDSTENQ